MKERRLFKKKPIPTSPWAPQNLPKKICILRLDTDFYSSTKIELEKLWPLLSKNGILIIDDYGFWQGCKKAVDNYFKKKKFLVHIDRSCRLIFKI